MSGPQPLVNSLHVLEPWVHRFWANLSGWCAGGGWGCGVSGGSECSKSTPSKLIFVAPWHPQTTFPGRSQPLRSCLDRGETGGHPHFDPCTHPHLPPPTPIQPSNPPPSSPPKPTTNRDQTALPTHLECSKAGQGHGGSGTTGHQPGGGAGLAIPARSLSWCGHGTAGPAGWWREGGGGGGSDSAPPS